MEYLVNGVLTSHLPCGDRAIQYGDGLFETIAVCNGRIEFWQRHMQRLAAGCERLAIPAPDATQLLAEARTLLKGDNGVLKIIISRGQGGRGYRPATLAETQPTRMLACYPWPDHPAANLTQGVVLRYCTTHTTLNPALAGIKHLNRLEQVLARGEWHDSAIAEGVMSDMNGNIIEGTMSNLFFVRAGQLHTPDLSNSGVAGIIRAVIMELAGRLSLPLQCQCYSRDDLESADEIFVTNSVIGIWPVCQIEKRSYPLGEITHQLLDGLNNRRLQKGEHESV